MYFYIHDTFLAERKYEKTIDRLKTKLLDLGIQGRHEKLTLLKSVDELIDDEKKRGTNTVVVIGNDKTFLKVIDAVAKHGMTLGILPVGEDNVLAKCLGITNEDEACDVISARKVVNFDLGKIDNQYFFTNIFIDKNLPRLSIQKGSYSVIPKMDCDCIEIVNFAVSEANQLDQEKLKISSAQDGRLEFVARRKVLSSGWFKKKPDGASIDTVIQSERFDVKSFEYLPILLDGYRILKTPVKVEVVRDKLSVIVGKNRLANIQ